jgi:hypothetical protein
MFFSRHRDFLFSRVLATQSWLRRPLFLVHKPRQQRFCVQFVVYQERVYLVVICFSCSVNQLVPIGVCSSLVFFFIGFLVLCDRGATSSFDLILNLVSEANSFLITM